ncbi:MGF 360-2L [African swine fever virus]|uniref:MGF 360-2L n=1 Tax=African swine fever virus TaxID=10497 RepID=A0A0C5AYS7_ASF|nr:MGF 360-2L [African swine fever virus]AJL34007.1 MGF 360-2L [African swine fever virus]
MSTPSSLQILVKRVLDFQHVSKDDYCILERCGLWWHGGPIMLSTNDEDHQMIKSASFKDGLEINVALMKAVQENNRSVIQLFTEWGADINVGLVTVNTEYTRNLCRELGAKDVLIERDILEIFCNIFCKIHRIRTSNNIILCHELLSNNPHMNENVEGLKVIICCFLEKISINFILDEISFSEMLTRLWYSIAVRHNLTEAIQYFYQQYRHFKDWRLICGLAYNNVFDLHEIYNKEEVDMDMNEMMQLACINNSNFLTIYYCFALGADINQAMCTSVKKFYINNLFFCIDLGATAFEECLKLANNGILVEILRFKDYYSSNASLLSLKTTDPEKINDLLKNYRSKNMLAYKKTPSVRIRRGRIFI